MNKFISKSKKAWKESWNTWNPNTKNYEFDLGNALDSSAAILGGATGIADAAISNAQIADTSAIEESIKDTKSTDFNYADFDSLQNAYNPYALQKTGYERKDVRGLSGLEMALNTGKGIINGALAGSKIGGGLGAAFGAIAGLGAGVGGIVIGNNEADKKAANLNATSTAANNTYLASISKNAGNISDNVFNSSVINMAEDGGKIKSSAPKYYGFDNYFSYGSSLPLSGDFSNGITIIGNGGTHEENPNGGVQIGVDENGVPNLVEEGEVIYNNYVFSNRLGADKEGLQEVNLNTKYDGHTFADIAKKLQKESAESPFDPISRNTLVDSMTKLMTLQEVVRAEKQQEEIQKESNMYRLGGDIYDWTNLASTINDYKTSLTPRGNGTYDYSRDMSSNEVKALENSDNYKLFTNFIINNSTNKNVLKYLKSLDDNTPSTTPKLFDASGNLVSNWADIFSNRRNDGEYGVYHIQPTRDASHLTKIGEEDVKVFNPRKVTPLSEKTIVGNKDYQDLPTKSSIKPEDYLEYNTNTNNDKLSKALRLATILGTGANTIRNLIKSNNPDYSVVEPFSNSIRGIRNIGGAHVGPYLAYNPFDTNYEQNKIANQSLASLNAILASTSGNRGAAMPGIYAINSSTNQSKGDVYRKALEYNDALEKTVKGFNRDTDTINAQLSMQAQQANQNADTRRAELAYRRAVLMDNIDTQLSNAYSTGLTNFFENLGGLGDDIYYRNQAKWYKNNRAPYNDATRAYVVKNGGPIKKGFTFFK